MVWVFKNKDSHLLNTEKFVNGLNNPKIKEITKEFLEIENLSKSIFISEQERPWVSPIVWSLYVAYKTVLIYGVSQFITIYAGYDPKKYVTDDKILKLLNEIIPGNNIESIESSQLLVYLEYLEDQLIIEIQRQITAKDFNNESLERAQSILKLASEINTKINSKPNEVQIPAW